MTTSNEERIAQLIQRLVDPSELVREQATAELQGFGAPSVQQLLEAAYDFKGKSHKVDHEDADLDEPNLDDVRLSEFQLLVLGVENCKQIISKVGPPAIPSLIKSLHDDRLQSYAADALGKMGRHTVTHLLQELKSDDPKVREMVLRAFYDIKGEAGNAIPQVLNCLNDVNVRVKCEAIDASVAISKSDEVLDRIKSLIADPEPVVRQAVLINLRMFEDRAMTAFEDIVTCLDEIEDYEEAALTLAVIGRPALFAIPHLIQAMRHEDTSHHEKICDALLAIGHESLWPVIATLEDPNEAVRLGAQNALRYFSLFGPFQFELVNDLLQRLESPNWHDQVLACKALGAIGERAKDAVPYLIDLSQTSAPKVRDAAIEAIKTIRRWSADN